MKNAFVVTVIILLAGCSAASYTTTTGPDGIELTRAQVSTSTVLTAEGAAGKICVDSAGAGACGVCSSTDSYTPQ